MSLLDDLNPTFPTQDLSDYLALLLVVVLGIFRLETVIKRLNIGIRLTREVSCDTEELLSNAQSPPDHHEIATNTDSIQTFEQASNTERVGVPIVLTGTTPPRYSECGTNTETPLLINRKTFISECTQTSRSNLVVRTVSSKSKIPVLLKKTRLYQHLSSPTTTPELACSSPDLPVNDTLSLHVETNSVSNLCPISRSSASSPSWESSSGLSPSWGRSNTPSPVPEVRESQNILTKLPSRSDVLKKSSTWTDRYRYCDSSIRNDVLLRSSKKKDTSIEPRQARWSVVEDSCTVSSRQDKRRSIRKCRSFGGETSDYVENELSPQNFVVNPRRRYPSNRRLYKVTYVTGS